MSTPYLPPQEIATWLESAADYIDANGWTQHTLRDGHAVCLLGAIEETAPFKYLRRGQLDAPAVAVGMTLRPITYTPGNDADMLAKWNDRRERVQQEVTHLLRSTAARLTGRKLDLPEPDLPVGQPETHNSTKEAVAV